MGDMADLIGEACDPDENDFEIYKSLEVKEITCKYCGASGLFWHKSPKGYHLIDRKSKKHICKNANPFEVIE